MIPTNELYYKYQSTINYMVNKYSRQNPELSEDISLQANYIFCKACYNYDESKGVAFQTWLSHQLLSVIDYVKHWNKGTKIDGKLNVPIRESKLDESKLTDINPYNICVDYSNKISMVSDVPTQLIEYTRYLSSDAMDIYRACINGELELSPNSNLSAHMRNAREHLNPIKIYRRAYFKKGWSLARVKTAWDELVDIMSKYVNSESVVVG